MASAEGAACQALSTNADAGDSSVGSCLVAVDQPSCGTLGLWAVRVNAQCGLGGLEGAVCTSAPLSETFVVS
ncbi:hypothetical protein PF005_g26043 [Phytophthora fragariae]|uniref:Uncharacterized protein n=1 Tax=Phytophthora fragariae TaxID=53985 RepID=A0A6A3LTU8_9STRA|nr:hypothetical protein PF003_g26687 [Phytophthora fragariae]KAE8941179.1 hypothetical protein PF009_g9016 [Phytophthora fragariae]KAE9022652.1 hypothetical protein PF011_g4348 [Phytophthora fragariae]KAE9118378.1 hypothetical protein PF007_g8945 [Phytophthora fragariae]KAE9121868.1 hypothetical protein PF010_g6946 [Phytophthora fragariae]